MQRLYGRDAAFTMLTGAKEKSRNESDKQKVDEAKLIDADTKRVDHN